MLLFHAVSFPALPSPSPRRAWIEIFDRHLQLGCRQMSPSPRRAWIEMLATRYNMPDIMVALPTEGVD